MMCWIRVLEILLLLQQCSAFGYYTMSNIEGSGVCGCEFSCEAFRGSGATRCYIIYQEEGMWQTEEHSLVHDEFLEQRQCSMGFRQHCYMFAVYPSYLQLSCEDSHTACRRASGSIAKMDTNHELYEFSAILANNIIKDYQLYSYKTIAEDLWYYNSLLKNTCADVQSMSFYGSDIQASVCGQRSNSKPVNSILCENAPLPINTYCGPNPTKSAPVQTTKKPIEATTKIIRKITPAIQPKGATIVPKIFTNPIQPTLKASNPGPKFPPHRDVPKFLPTWWPRKVTTPTNQPPTKSKFKKKKMVVNDKEPHNKKKKKSNVTHLITGIFFVGTILMVGFALLVGCFFKKRNDQQVDIYRWSNASDPPNKMSPQTYEDVDARNAASDHNDGYSVINNVEKRQNKRIDSVSKRLSQDQCRRYRMSEIVTTDKKFKSNNLSELHYQQDIHARDARRYKAQVRGYNADRLSSGISIGSSRSSAHYEIHDFLEYDYAYSNNRHVIKSPDVYVVGNNQDLSYDYAYAESKNVQKPKKTKPRHKRDKLHGDV